MAKRILFAFLVALAALDATAQSKEKDRVAVCHFGDGSDVALLTLPRNAVDAHLKHGDLLAPPSVKVAADCLVPQAPPQPVAHAVTTDAAGKATFVIPQTNIVAAIEVTSADGPVSGANVEMLVIEGDWLLIVTGGDRYSPAVAEGKLSDARPGSALRITVPITLPPPGTPPPPIPNIVRTRFGQSEDCFTQDELHQHLRLACTLAFSGVRFVIFTFIGVPAATRVSFQYGVPIFAMCDDIAKQAAASAFGSGTMPMRIRSYTPPSSPSLLNVPIFLEGVDSCGGACCSGLQCVPRSSEPKCGATYFPGEECRAGLCKVGACCDASGCTVMSRLDCANRGGTYRGDDTTCTPDPCKKGACCDGTNCSIVTRFDCAARNGVYRGDDTTCSPDPCKKGACCDGVNCSALTKTDCAARNGTYQGDDTVCSPNPCDRGACCNPRSGCTMTTPIQCTNDGGTFHGPNTDCGRFPNPPTPLVWNLQSGGGAGGASFPIPYSHGMLRTTITIPPNQFGKDCQRHWRVEIRICPFNAGCTGGTWYAGQHFSICHTAPETLTFTQLNSPLPCSHYSINALTGTVSQVKVEMIPQ